MGILNDKALVAIISICYPGLPPYLRYLPSFYSPHHPHPSAVRTPLFCEMTRTLPRGNYRRMEDWPEPNPNIGEVKFDPDNPLLQFASSGKKSIIDACVPQSYQLPLT